MSAMEPLLEGAAIPAEEAPPRLSLSFYLIWFGQAISMFGSTLTSFSIGVWLFQETGSILDFMHLMLFSTVPALLLLPYTGAFADRHDKRRILIGCEILALLCMGTMGWLIWAGQFAIWQLYVVQVVLAVGIAFQGPAAYATVTNLVPKQLFGQAAGMFGLATAASQIGAPLLAAMLLGMIGLSGIILLDMATFAVALVGLLIARIPPHPKLEEKAVRPNPLRNMLWAIGYLRQRPTMLIIYGYTCLAGFLASIVIVLVTPMVLSAYSPAVLARISTAGAVGGLVSGMIMLAWGGPKKWTPLLLGFTLLQGLAIALAGYTRSVAVLCLCAFAVMLASTMLSSCTQVVWRRKVPRERQGSFSGLQQFVSLSLLPLSALLGGLFANYLFEPALLEGGWWADSVGEWIGIGKGRGTGFLFFVIGCVTVIASLVSLADRRLYRLEEEVADAF